MRLLSIPSSLRLLGYSAASRDSASTRPENANRATCPPGHACLFHDGRRCIIPAFPSRELWNEHGSDCESSDQSAAMNIRRRMSLREIKYLLAAAMRAQDWETFKRLSQKREMEKRRARQYGHCSVCGATISGDAHKCQWHANHRRVNLIWDTRGNEPNRGHTIPSAD